ncbi:Endonuclease/exonuclease/phosphatase [Schizophyllum amplum]|uniref:Endonuclease/exonuclease/phosphatase n=1 Tax=Schizophyllum amplum TaxID=97359 RepID=A0A550BZ60_9AGAR|nr:Endonuclease/exonuclease/phosphatase [Auriculariopsis ampla]
MDSEAIDQSRRTSSVPRSRDLASASDFKFNDHGRITDPTSQRPAVRTEDNSFKRLTYEHSTFEPPSQHRTMTITGLRRVISAFNNSTRRWAAITSPPPRLSSPSSELFPGRFSMQGQPPSAQRQPLSTQRQSLSTQRQPPSTQRQPLSIQRQRLSLVTWNIDAFTSRPVARAKCILDHILLAPPDDISLAPPDIVFLQEVTRDTRAALLNDARVRATFLVTDAEDDTAFEGVPFATMTLLSRARFFASGVESESPADSESSASGAGSEAPAPGARSEKALVLEVGRVSRIPLPSKYKRDALCVDVQTDRTVATTTDRIVAATTDSTVAATADRPVAATTDRIAAATTDRPVLRLINVHLDSLGDTLHYRAQQLAILAGILREPGNLREPDSMHEPDGEPGCVGESGILAPSCAGGIIAGDFNAISREDDGLVEENGLVDAWVALHGTEKGGATWGVGVERRDALGPGRLDKVAMMGVEVEGMEILRPGLIEIPRPGRDSLQKPWSDHCGLRCTFII